MKLKPGASIVGVHWRMFDAALKIEPIFDLTGVELVITSGNDSKHMAGSLHYRGLGLDFRTRDLKTLAAVNDVARKVRKTLGPDYDVIVEKDHLHVEWDNRILLIQKGQAAKTEALEKKANK